MEPDFPWASIIQQPTQAPLDPSLTLPSALESPTIPGFPGARPTVPPRIMPGPPLLSPPAPDAQMPLTPVQSLEPTAPPPVAPAPPVAPGMPGVPPVGDVPFKSSPAGSGMGTRAGREGGSETDVGAALTGGVPIPSPRPPIMAQGGDGAAGPISLGGPGGPTPLRGGAASPAVAQQQKLAGLAAALKGVQAPAPPALQKISSPNAPRPTGTIQGGGLQQLLMALNAGGVGQPGQRPATLGSAIGR